MNKPFTVAFIVFSSVAYLFFGLWGLIHGSSMWSLLSISPQTYDGTFELTAVYGGINLMLGGLLAVSLHRPDIRRSALAAAGVNVLGLATGRLYAWVFMGTPSAWLLVLMITEFGLAAIAFWLLNRPDDSPGRRTYSVAR